MRSLCILLLSVLLLGTAHAETVVIKSVPEATSVGTGRLTYLFWDVYDATLYAPKGEWSREKPFALTLHYLRHLDGHAIADRSVQEMRQQGFDDEVRLATWHTQMQDIFPDVQDGTKLTGIFVPGGATEFYLGDQHIGAIHDPMFGQWFFNIWLSEYTSEPQLRRKLLGHS